MNSRSARRPCWHSSRFRSHWRCLPPLELSCRLVSITDVSPFRGHNPSLQERQPSMSNGIIGVNTRTIGVSRDQIMSAARQIGSAWILCHNDPDLVREANAAGFRTIYRQSDDDNLGMDAAQFARTRLEKGATLAHSY